jgi:hypothetical protein
MNESLLLKINFTSSVTHSAIIVSMDDVEMEKFRSKGFGKSLFTFSMPVPDSCDEQFFFDISK